MRKALRAGALAAALALTAPSGVALAAAGTSPTSPGSTGCLATGHGAQLAASAAAAAGFSPEQLAVAVAIVGAESGYDPTATHLNNDGSTDYGMWQVNSVHPDLLTHGDWRDRVANEKMPLRS